MDQKNLKLFNTDKYVCTIDIQYFLPKLSKKKQKKLRKIKLKIY